MDQQTRWIDIGAVEELKRRELQEIQVEGRTVALSFRDGAFGAVSGSCLHVGGPLGKACFKDNYLVCPWHGWMFDRQTGRARPEIPAAVPSYALREEQGRLLISAAPVTQARHAHHPPHPLGRDIVREPGPVRVAGISTTAMDPALPRYSTSEDLLQTALQHAEGTLGCQTRLIRLNDLKFRHCEGYYSKAAEACTWPCTITQMDPSDQMDQVYEAMVFWADVILVATPIRWGAAGSLYFKMAERMNCIQNQVTLADRVLIRNKVASFIITGGQDNIQAVAGQMLTFFGELGFQFPQFPFIAHSRGWTAEDMERNMEHVRTDADLRQGARELAGRAVESVRALLATGEGSGHTARGGRKAN